MPSLFIYYNMDFFSYHVEYLTMAKKFNANRFLSAHTALSYLYFLDPNLRKILCFKVDLEFLAHVYRLLLSVSFVKLSDI